MHEVEPLFKIIVRTIIKEHLKELLEAAAYYHHCLSNTDHFDEKEDIPEVIDPKLAIAIQNAALAQKSLTIIEAESENENKSAIEETEIDEKKGLDEQPRYERVHGKFKKEYEKVIDEQEQYIQTIILSSIEPFLLENKISVSYPDIPCREIWKVALQEHEKISKVNDFFWRADTQSENDVWVEEYRDDEIFKVFNNTVQNMDINFQYGQDAGIDCNKTLTITFKNCFSILNENCNNKEKLKGIIELIYGRAAFKGHIGLMHKLENLYIALTKSNDFKTLLPLYKRALKDALAGDYPELLQAIWPKHAQYSEKISLLEGQYFYADGNPLKKFGLIMLAVHLDQFKFAQWLFMELNREDRKIILDSSMLLFFVAQRSNLKFFKLFWEEISTDTERKLLNEGIDGTGRSMNIIDLLRYAADGDNHDILKFLSDITVEHKGELYIAQALKERYRVSFSNASLNVKKWLAEEIPESLDEMIEADGYHAFYFPDCPDTQNFLWEIAPNHRDKILNHDNYKAFRIGDLEFIKRLWEDVAPELQKEMLIACKSKDNYRFNENIIWMTIFDIVAGDISRQAVPAKIKKLDWLCGKALVQHPEVIEFARNAILDVGEKTHVKVLSVGLIRTFNEIKRGTSGNVNSFVFLLLSMPQDTLCNLKPEFCEKIIGKKQILLDADILKVNCNIDVKKLFSDALDVINSVAISTNNLEEYLPDEVNQLQKDGFAPNHIIARINEVISYKISQSQQGIIPELDLDRIRKLKLRLMADINNRWYSFFPEQNQGQDPEQKQDQDRLISYDNNQNQFVSYSKK